MSGHLWATWSTCDRAADRFQGVVKKVGTDAWVWGCELRLGHAHLLRADAIARAREQLAKKRDPIK